ncbi:unnamed protein product [Paramecium pentaurelia]|uniref:WD40-repeat-containing domain n=1 Tax=Paramecium pentaurelia TaxID=43138 RepID=A0A8S1X626_9CILI|nr:unnamed protein product [Paramecium pentaurelia]
MLFLIKFLFFLIQVFLQVILIKFHHFLKYHQIQFKHQNQLKQIKQQNNIKGIIKQDNNYQFNLIQNHSIQQNQRCNAIAFNKDNSIVLATCENDIKVFEFKQEQLRQTQILSEHKDFVTTLNFMKKSNQFISASFDKQILIWSMNHNNQWIRQQKLNGDSYSSCCLVLNKNEDLIILGCNDNTIKFWMKQNEWLCSQTFTDHTGNVCGLSLNDQQNKVISCGYDYLILIIEQTLQGYKWNVIQKISIQMFGYRLCFINDNLFAFQSYNQDLMHVYEMSITNKQYIKTKDISVKRGGKCAFFFPQQYIHSKCLLVNKNGCYVNLIRKNQNGDFISLQSIDYGTSDLYGQMSEDGEYLITWDDKSKQIQIRKCHYE